MADWISKVAALSIAMCLIIGPTANAATPTAQGARVASSSTSDSSGSMSGRIDALLEQQCLTAGVQQAALASDAEFMRRAYLDLTGVIPRVSKVRDFLADQRPDKRERLIDELLDSPRYATHMATTWRNRILPMGVEPDRNREAIALQKWLRTRFAKNLRYDNLVGELLVTVGGEELGPALYFQANDLSPEKLAGSAAELFLGVELHCAQCHDHPHADWSQRDFWGFAAFFARVQSRDDPRTAMGMGRPLRLVDVDRGDVRLPNTEEVVPPRYPRGDAATQDGRRSRRVQLALWITSPENTFFPRAAVNWAWSHLFGRGLVDSLDGEKQGTVNRQLLDELAQHFVDSEYDLRDLLRTLANSRAYQLSAQYDGAEPSPTFFAHILAKPLTPEQLYDSFQVLAPTHAKEPVRGMGNVTSSLDEDPQRLDFVRQMRSPSRDRTEFGAGTLQVLLLMNGGVAGGVSMPDAAMIAALDAPFMSDENRIESLFLATLCREPDTDEQQACIQQLKDCNSNTERNRAMSDVLWALLNSTEFAFNH